MKAKNNNIIFDLVDNTKLDANLSMDCPAYDFPKTPSQGIVDDEIFYFINDGGFSKIKDKYVIDDSLVFKKSEKLVMPEIVICRKKEIKQTVSGLVVCNWDFFMVYESNIAEIPVNSLVVSFPHTSYLYLENGSPRWMIRRESIVLVVDKELNPGPDYLMFPERLIRNL